MEAIAMYLLKSVTWLTGFLIVFILFLKNERYFTLNRIYLITGILASVLLPFITIRYVVELPVISNVIPAVQDNVVVKNSGNTWANLTVMLIFLLYISGIMLVIYRAYSQNRHILKTIRKTGNSNGDPVKLIRTADYASSFSYFSYIFINPSVSDDETREIMNHELVHVKQMHWIDLVLARVLCTIQWFNPLVWIYIRYIRQNHEYLADEVALQLTSNPAVYRAALLNQTIGMHVTGLANSFNESLTKKRFNMMKKIISSPYRKLKFFLVLPVSAIILYVFATPVYSFPSQPETNNNDNVNIQEINKKQVPQAGNNEKIVFNTQDTTVKGKKDKSMVAPPPPPVKEVQGSELPTPPAPPPVPAGQEKQLPAPPPPPPPVNDSNKVIIRKAHDEHSFNTDIGEVIQVSGKDKALIIIDGKKTDIDVNLLNPDKIESLSVLKGDNAVAKYGKEGKHGVIIIVTKSTPTKTVVEGHNTPTKIVIEEHDKLLTGPDAPLVVIDGKISKKGIDDISPDQISSVTVLKDEHATAKYGEAGKNGVIEITTKEAR